MNYRTERRIRRGAESIITGNQIQSTLVVTQRARRHAIMRTHLHNEDDPFFDLEHEYHSLDASYEEDDVIYISDDSQGQGNVSFSFLKL